MAEPGNADEIRAILQAAVWKRGTQRELAEFLGFSQKHVSEMLNGHAGMSLDSLMAIADYAGITLILADTSED